MAFDSPQPVDFNYFLQRKYALLQQQADAGTSNAASGAIQATAQAGALGAEAGLNKVRAQLAPGESAAQIGLQGSQTNLNNQSASVIVPESKARIGQIGAETDLLGTQNRVLTKTNANTLPGSGTLPGGATPYSGYRLGSDTPLSTATTPTARLPNEGYDAWVARLRSAGY